MMRAALVLAAVLAMAGQLADAAARVTVHEETKEGPKDCFVEEVKTQPGMAGAWGPLHVLGGEERKEVEQTLRGVWAETRSALGARGEVGLLAKAVQVVAGLNVEIVFMLDGQGYRLRYYQDLNERINDARVEPCEMPTIRIPDAEAIELGLLG